MNKFITSKSIFSKLFTIFAAKNHDSDSNSFTETKGWREQITDILLNMSPYAFEKLAQR